MSRPASPREVFHRLLDGVTGQRWDELPDLYAGDCLVEHPFAAGGPERRIEGREAIRTHFARASGLPLAMTAHEVVVHETTDPEVVIGEFDYHCRNTATDRDFVVNNIFVLRVRDGQIVESRDYANHRVFAEEVGRLPQGSTR